MELKPEFRFTEYIDGLVKQRGWYCVWTSAWCPRLGLSPGERRPTVEGDGLFSGVICEIWGVIQ